MLTSWSPVQRCQDFPTGRTSCPARSAHPVQRERSSRRRRRTRFSCARSTGARCRESGDMCSRATSCPRCGVGQGLPDEAQQRRADKLTAQVFMEYIVPDGADAEGVGSARNGLRLTGSLHKYLQASRLFLYPVCIDSYLKHICLFSAIIRSALQGTSAWTTSPPHALRFPTSRPLSSALSGRSLF